MALPRPPSRARFLRLRVLRWEARACLPPKGRLQQPCAGQELRLLPDARRAPALRRPVPRPLRLRLAQAVCGRRGRQTPNARRQAGKVRRLSTRGLAASERGPRALLGER
eukprot:8313255-Alexandrium_andersonii.AAC.1